MLRTCPPVPNAERQRQFRERNPGYRNRFRTELTPEQLEAVRAQYHAALAEKARIEHETPKPWYASA